MSYFLQFPYILYPNFNDQSGNTFNILKNITIRVVRTISPTDDKSLYYKYLIKEGETIESISYKIYDSSEYYWVLMLINERYDRFYDFPLDSEQFQKYIVDKYGSVSAAQTTYKYYIREAYERYSNNVGETVESQINGATGFLTNDLIGSVVEDNSFFIEVPQIDYDFINPDTNTPRPISQNGRIMKKAKSLYEYEFELNESKRNINILNEEYLSDFIKLFNALVS